MEGYHKSVLLREAIEALGVEKRKWYIDGTLGDGGHCLEILRLGGNVIGLDVDPEALKRARKRLQDAGYGGQDFTLVQGNFRDLKNLIQTETKFAGVLFDLGVSSLQLESPERGFSFGKDGPLDMRMDPNLDIQALDFVNRLSRKELHELFYSLGEEKHSRRLVDALVRTREVKEFRTTRELAELVEKIIGGRNGKIHPATKVFQALRIAVNDELDALKEGLEQVKDLINKNGHIVIISFHSLEDRIVKNTFIEWEDREFGQVLTKKPVVPSDGEIRENPRSRSAKLRVFKII